MEIRGKPDELDRVAHVIGVPICRPTDRSSHDSSLEETGFEPSVPLSEKGLSAVAERRCRTDKLDGSLSTGHLPQRRWLGAGPLSTAVSLTAGPMVRIRLPPAESRANSEWPARHLNSWRHPGRGACCRDEVVAEGKIVYLRNVGQGSSGLEGEACSTLAMSSQRRSGTAPR